MGDDYLRRPNYVAPLTNLQDQNFQFHNAALAELYYWWRYKRIEYHCLWVILRYAVCLTAGYLMSYWNRPFFPEFCGDAEAATYDTMVRIAGTWAGVARSFKAVANMYGWTYIVLLSDDELSKICWDGAQPFEDVFGHDENYTFTWLRLGSRPTDEELDDILQEIRSRTRGIYSFISLFRFRLTTSSNTE